MDRGGDDRTTASRMNDRAYSNQANSVLGTLPLRLGLGLLRLSTEGRPASEDAIALIHRALDLGIRLLDTADSYALDDKDFHYGESLARQAISTWHGPAHEVRVLTKVGLARPKGKWIPAGNTKHLVKSIDGSLVALGVDQLEIVQLHARDPRVPFEETLATLASLQREGKIRHLGLCNVGPAEVMQAQRHFEVVSVQNELSILSRQTAVEGMLAMTARLGIPFLAHRPLGGYAKVAKLESNRVLAPIAARHQDTPHSIALAAVLHAAPHVIPLIGATRLASLEASVRATERRLDISDQTALSIKYSFDAHPDSMSAIAPRVLPTSLPKLLPQESPGQVSEVVLVMGIQGAGKSELVASYLSHGYERLNRDLLGGKLDDLVPELRRLLANGKTRIVLDNTYPTRISRAPVIAAAHEANIPVRCRYLMTSLQDARINIVLRTLERYHRLLGPDDFKALAKSDPNLPPPIAMQRWLESLEPPAIDEGFSVIDEIPFQRRVPIEHRKRALLLDVDGTLRRTASGEVYPRHADDVVLIPGRREVLQRWIEAGYELYFVSNQSGVASGKLTQQEADGAFQRTIDLLRLDVAEVAYCPHPAFPANCFCRKPMPGLGIYLAHRHQLDLSQCVMVGDMDSDEAFAKGLGMRYVDAEKFFAGCGDQWRVE